MSAHPLDFVAGHRAFATDAMRDVWSERARFSAQLKVEGALALAQSELGLIPRDAGERIAAAARDEYDLDAIAEEGALAQHSLIAIIHALQTHAGSAGEWVHWGVTTQDIADTGTVLQVAASIPLLEQDARGIAEALARLADRHRATAMIGRTHFVQAVPTTFGFVAAVWLDEFLRHLDRLERGRRSVLVGNITGAVGTFSAFGGAGAEVQRRTLAKLGLASPAISWQAARDRIGEYAATLSLLAAASGKIATDLALLMQTEIGEVDEPFSTGKIGSSTMPHKRNPASLEAVAALTGPARHAFGLVLEGQGTIYQRDAVSLRSERLGLIELHCYLSAQLDGLRRVLDGLIVHPERMADNLARQGALTASEHAMFALGRALGKQTAHRIVYEAAMEAEETVRPFRDVLLADPRVAARFGADDIADALRSGEGTGESAEVVDGIIAEAHRRGVR